MVFGKSSTTARHSRAPWSMITGAVLMASAAGVVAALPPAPANADFQEHNLDKVELGRLLFFDKILSGNRNTSCATCHHTLADTGDGLSLPVGEGGKGLGMTRDTGSGLDAIHERVPRNAPPVFNLGHNSFTVMFRDGRVEEDPSQPGGFLSPAGDQLPDGLESALAVQAMFPVTSPTEMAGQSLEKGKKWENPVAEAAAAGDLAGENGVWALLAARLQANRDYVKLFKKAYLGEIRKARDITFVHAANAIAAFEATAWRADNSPFDRFLRGERNAMSGKAKQGMRLFYGKAGCARCHSGPFQTDLSYHAIGIPQIGNGKGDGLNGHDDFGREQVTGDSVDRYRFLTSTLRNVDLTGPWGHDGAYNTLEGVVRHHLQPVESLDGYDTTQAVLPSRPDLDAIDFEVHEDLDSRAALAAAAAVDIQPVHLNDYQVAAILDFLHALTDPASLDLRSDTPMSVPSGLPVAD